LKYYLIAGEASGDLHGSNLIKEIKKIELENESMSKYTPLLKLYDRADILNDLI